MISPVGIKWNVDDLPLLRQIGTREALSHKSPYARYSDHLTDSRGGSLGERCALGSGYRDKSQQQYSVHRLWPGWISLSGPGVAIGGHPKKWSAR